MKPLKSTVRRGALFSLTAVCALALTACSAGQITQTSSQVAAVDGVEGETANNAIAVRDVTIHLTSEGEAGLKFTAINQDPQATAHVLRSVTVGGTRVSFEDDTTIAPDCSLVSDIRSELDLLTEPENICITHVASSFNNPGFAYGGNQEVVFTFDDGKISLSATVSEPVPVSGHNVRDTGSGTGAQH